MNKVMRSVSAIKVTPTKFFRTKIAMGLATMGGEGKRLSYLTKMIEDGNVKYAIVRESVKESEENANKVTHLAFRLEFKPEMSQYRLERINKMLLRMIGISGVTETRVAKAIRPNYKYELITRFVAPIQF